MARKAFYFDQEACVGCRGCQIVCKDKMEGAELQQGVFYRTVTNYESGSFPKVGRFSVSMTCNHCENPACVAACPQKAIYKAEDGTVLQDASLCIGCGTCAAACPYGVPQIVNNKMAKCDGCAARVAKGEKPLCVDACTMRALDFGEYDELVAKYGSDLVSDLSVLPDSTITGANLLIKARACALEADVREMNL